MVEKYITHYLCYLHNSRRKSISRFGFCRQSGGGNNTEPIEVAYSGGKDSDVILQLAKEAGIPYRAIYKNTTIDPPGTVRHAREVGAEVRMPERTFFELITQYGFPSHLHRFCCKYLKEYKVLDKVVMGIRRSESPKRKHRYQEPTECKWYGSKKNPEKNHVEAVYPILDWTDDDVREFIIDRGIKCAPVYYDEQGEFHVERRLWCIACPLAWFTKRIPMFKQYPYMVKGYLRAGQKYRDTHPNVKTVLRHPDVYEWFYRDVFCRNQQQFDEINNSISGKPDYKALLEEEFGIDLTI